MKITPVSSSIDLKNSRSTYQREKLLFCAGNLFWKKGYLGTSVEEIAAAAKVNKAIIYYYFNNKATMLFELASRAAQGLIHQALPIVDSNMEPDEKLKNLVLKHIEFTLTHLGFSGIGQIDMKNLPPKLLRAYIEKRDEYEAIIRRVLETGIQQGKFRPLDTKLASMFILGLLNSIVHWFKFEGRLSVEEIALQVQYFIFEKLLMEAKI